MTRHAFFGSLVLVFPILMGAAPLDGTFSYQG